LRGLKKAKTQNFNEGNEMVNVQGENNTITPLVVEEMKADGEEGAAVANE
jgi:hypothetical protein